MKFTFLADILTDKMISKRTTAMCIFWCKWQTGGHNQHYIQNNVVCDITYWFTVYICITTLCTAVGTTYRHYVLQQWR